LSLPVSFLLSDKLNGASFIHLFTHYPNFQSAIFSPTQGMAFIHNKTNIGSHGNLKTTNILVSDNFTMKIADYGECVFMSDMKKMYHHSELEYNKRTISPSTVNLLSSIIFF
jgi:hypothetical protein